MSVYVDDARIRYGRMRMSHMVADSTDELLAMADRIGVARRWLQRAGTHREHLDVCDQMRALAIRHGAQQISMRELGALLRARKAAKPLSENKPKCPGCGKDLVVTGPLPDVDPRFECHSARDQCAWSTFELPEKIACAPRHYEQERARIVRQLDEAVSASCACGGRPPDDPDMCPACEVWHRFNGRIGVTKP